MEVKKGRKSSALKTSYDYPNATGAFSCIKCGKSSSLPANYCCHCGKELEEYQKQGLKN